MRLLNSFLLSIMLVSIDAQCCVAAGRGAELIREMKRTGKPALIIAGNESCVYCRVMAQELATVKEIQPLVRQFLVLKVDTDTADWPAVRNALQFDGSGIPAVFVIRADGELLYSNSGKPNDVGAFLENQLKEAGTILESEQLQQIQRSARNAQRALKRGDIEDAIKLVKEHQVEGSYAEAALALQALQTELVETAATQAADAEELISRRDKQLEAARSLAELKRTYSNLQEAADAIDTVWSRLAADDDYSALLGHAERLDQAALHVESREWEAAAAIYRELIDDAPDSETATRAQADLAEVEKRMETAESPDGDRKPASQASEGDPQKAASYLKFAKVYLERDADKARKYLQRAIDAAPESEAAAEAEQLLGELD